MGSENCRHKNNRKTYPNHDPMDPTPQAQILKNVFFILNYTTSRDIRGLNSSLAQSAAQLWLAKVCPGRANYTFSKTFEFCQKLVFEP